MTTNDQLPERIPATTGPDVAAIALRGTLGAVPIVGALMAEIAGSIIPSQRLDRIHRFVEIIGVKLDSLSDEVRHLRMTAPHAVDLLEDCFLSAARARSDERLSYLAELYVSGIKADKADTERDKVLIRLLDSLTDAEVIWLAHIADRHTSNLKEKNPSVLTQVAAHPRSDREAYDKQTIQKAWRNRLEDLGLVTKKLRINSRSKTPEVDSATGDWKREYEQVTWLGRMLLNRIGIADGYRTPKEKPQS